MRDRPRIIPDLGEFTPRDGTPYRPSNGTEGYYFEQGWCEHCKCDRAYRDNGYENGALGCPILAKAQAFNARDPGFPKEWVWQDGEPVCTAFDDVDERITNEERAAQVPLPI